MLKVLRLTWSRDFNKGCPLVLLIFGTAFLTFCNSASRYQRPHQQVFLVPDACNLVNGGEHLCTVGSPKDVGLDFSCGTMKDALWEFAEVYLRSPNRNNEGGVLFWHAFYIWYQVRTLKPKHIIESGAWKGIGTWFLRQAATNAQIIVISPETPISYVDRRSDSVYFTGQRFTDFNKVNWNALNIDPRETFIFFDDHQAGIRRIQEAHSFGFRHMTFDDNLAPYADGDSFTLKMACDRGQYNKPHFPVWRDDFNRYSREMNRDEVESHYLNFMKLVDVYYEMPPLWPFALNEKWARNYLLTDKEGEDIRNYVLWNTSVQYGFAPYVHLND